MPEVTVSHSDPGASLVGEEPVIQDDTIEPEPDEEPTSEEQEVAEQEPGQAEEGAPEGEESPEGGAKQEAGSDDDVATWKARAEKNERIARQFQSQHDQLIRQVQPYAARLAEMIRSDQEKAQKLQADRDTLLREFANDPAGVINVLVSANLNAVRSQEQVAAVQVEAQQAYISLAEYAAERGVDENNLTLLLAPYGNFAHLHPKQALELAKVVVDKAVKPQADASLTQAALKAADQQTKQKLIKKTPPGAAGGSVQGKKETADDEFWSRIRNSGSVNPLKSLR